MSYVAWLDFSGHVSICSDSTDRIFIFTHSLNTRASRREKLDDVVMLGSLPLSFARSPSTLNMDDDTEANLHS
jgi:hypothetical protein